MSKNMTARFKDDSFRRPNLGFDGMVPELLQSKPEPKPWWELDEIKNWSPPAYPSSRLDASVAFRLEKAQALFPILSLHVRRMTRIRLSYCQHCPSGNRPYSRARRSANRGQKGRNDHDCQTAIAGSYAENEGRADRA